jgi:hypothetical protein
MVGCLAAEAFTDLDGPSHRPPRLGPFFCLLSEHTQSRDVVVPPTANALRLVQKKFPVAKGCFCILVNGNDYGLHVLIAPTFARRQLPDLRQRFDEGRVVSVVVKPFERFTHHHHVAL